MIPWFDYPLNLHISQTAELSDTQQLKFDYPLNLHISQTAELSDTQQLKFDYPLNLHISQTAAGTPSLRSSLIIL